MAEARIEISIGSASFSGEGDSKWLAEQLDKFIKYAPELVNLPGAESGVESNTDSAAKTNPSDKRTTGTLAAYLRDRNVSAQVDRFLATAVWLTRRGSSRMTTTDVSSALRENHQQRLKNASDCLSKNVSKGYCEKVGKQFFVTPDGMAHIG